MVKLPVSLFKISKFLFSNFKTVVLLPTPIDCPIAICALFPPSENTSNCDPLMVTPAPVVTNLSVSL